MLESALQSDLAGVLAAFGEGASYTDGEGAATALPALVETEPPDARPDDGGRQQVQRATAIIRSADVAEPRVGHTLTAGGLAWSIRSVERLTAAFWRLGLNRTEPLERSREGYRGR